MMMKPATPLGHRHVGVRDPLIRLRCEPDQCEAYGFRVMTPYGPRLCLLALREDGYWYAYLANRRYDDFISSSGSRPTADEAVAALIHRLEV
jgi:hypothetical protein